MKKKHLIKLIDLLLDNNAFTIGTVTNRVMITDEMKDVLKKLKGKQKPSKLQEAVMTIIKEQKKRGEKIEIDPSKIIIAEPVMIKENKSKPIPPPPPPPPPRILKEGQEPPKPPADRFPNKPTPPPSQVIKEGENPRPYTGHPKWQDIRPSHC